MITYETHDNVVVAKFTKEGWNLKRIWRNSLLEILDKYVGGTVFDNYRMAYDIVDKVLQDRKLVGVAKCHPNDEFSLEEGKRLAREDLIRRFNNAERQLQKEMLYAIRHEVEVVKNRV